MQFIGVMVWHAFTHPEPNSNTELTVARSAACSKACVAGPAHSQNQAFEREEVGRNLYMFQPDNESDCMSHEMALTVC